MKSMRTMLVLLAGLALPGAALAQSALLTPQALPEGFAPRQGTAAAMGVRPDLGRIESLAVGDEVLVPVEPGVTYTGRVTRVVRISPGRVTIEGEILEAANAEFLLCMELDAVAMNVRVPTLGGLYRLQYVADGLHASCKLDERLLPDCGGTIVPAPAIPEPEDPDDDDRFTVEAGSTGDGVGSGDSGFGDRTAGCTQSIPVLDVMVVYTDVARAAAGGTNAIRAESRLAIESTNTGYARSGITVRQRLVWNGEVTYNESGNFENHLNRITDPNDGFFDWINTTRDSVNADLCAMYVDDTSSGGLAWCVVQDNEYPYSITRWDLAASTFVHAHETGHNLGCAHDPDNADCSPASSYGYGHRFNGTDGVQYRTIMSYAPGTRINNFSNPNVNFQGTATGTSTRHNSRIINDRDLILANLQFTRWDIYVNLSYVGVENGTYVLPYNTVSEGVNAIAVGTNAGELPSLYIRTGTSTYVGTITKAMEIRACSGVVNIGGNP
jgi:hypothetical protein